MASSEVASSADRGMRPLGGLGLARTALRDRVSRD